MICYKKASTRVVDGLQLSRQHVWSYLNFLIGERVLEYCGPSGAHCICTWNLQIRGYTTKNALADSTSWDIQSERVLSFKKPTYSKYIKGLNHLDIEDAATTRVPFSDGNNSTLIIIFLQMNHSQNTPVDSQSSFQNQATVYLVKFKDNIEKNS